MSMHTVVNELFQREISPEFNGNVQLSSADVNRIVTNTVQNFSLVEDTRSMLAQNIRDYVAKYKAPRKGGCGCGK